MWFGIGWFVAVWLYMLVVLAMLIRPIGRIYDGIIYDDGLGCGSV